MITIKEYIQQLQKLVEKYPDAMLVFAKDAEGNGFDTVEWSPTEGFYSEREFTPLANFSDLDEEPEINAICIN